MKPTLSKLDMKHLCRKGISELSNEESKLRGDAIDNDENTVYVFMIRAFKNN